jgi:hypothetical protein
MTPEEEIQLGAALLSAIVNLAKQWEAAKAGTVKASDVLAQIASYQANEVKDDTAAEATLDKRFPTG